MPVNFGKHIVSSIHRYSVLSKWHVCSKLINLWPPISKLNPKILNVSAIDYKNAHAIKPHPRFF